LVIDVPLCGDIIYLFCKNNIFYHYYLHLLIRKPIDMGIYKEFLVLVMNMLSIAVVDAFDLRVGNDTVPVSL